MHCTFLQRFLHVCLLPFWFLPALAHADDVLPMVRHGYAFDRPPILIQQQLFGLAHGAALLADACAQEEHREDVATAYREWEERQAPTLARTTRDLARYYFDTRAGEATRSDIAHALGLKDSLALAPASKELQAACATFTQALRNPRYDLTMQYRLQLMAARLEMGTRVEATTNACRSLLAQHDAEALEAAFTQWHEAHAAEIAEARAGLDAEWAALQWQGTVDEFIAAARQRGQRSATRARCQAMAEQISLRDDKTNDASPRP